MDQFYCVHVNSRGARTRELGVEIEAFSESY
jgi:hypothetical protein